MWESVDTILDEAVEHGLVAGCALCVRSGAEEIHVARSGWAESRPRRRRVSVDQAWDVASLTKVLVTTPLTMAMVDRGLLALETEVREVLGDGPEGVTVSHCLQHTTGLPAWRPLYEVPSVCALPWGSEAARVEVLRIARSTEPVASPGEVYAYS
ncbi:MAG: serine hydrolase domain-containing protein, partial [Myxococcota bacterium]|nr:serine hydrolase domain-containing protein [Myxococcota bacterium]